MCYAYALLCKEILERHPTFTLVVAILSTASGLTSIYIHHEILCAHSFPCAFIKGNARNSLDAKLRERGSGRKDRWLNTVRTPVDTCSGQPDRNQTVPGGQLYGAVKQHAAGGRRWPDHLSWRHSAHVIDLNQCVRRAPSSGIRGVVTGSFLWPRIPETLPFLSKELRAPEYGSLARVLVPRHSLCPSPSSPSLAAFV